LRTNAETLQRRGGGHPLCAVVKADAYGHGAIAVARELELTSAAFLGVTLFEEGVALRDAGIRAPILVLGGAFGSQGFAAVVEHGLTPVIWRVDHLAELAAAARGSAIAYHLKVDTGMSRLGAQADELESFLAAASATPQLRLDGFMSHFASADVVDDPKNLEQVASYTSAIAQIRRHGLSPRWLHFANTPALLTGVHGGVHTLLRPGGGLYGLDTRDKRTGDDPLVPILRWATKRIRVKHVPAGTSVSYGARWTAKRDSIVATLPVGYADGYPRIMTSKAKVLVKGELAPVVGTICMDLCLADVTDIPGVWADDEVVLIGAQGNRRLTADDLASWAGTISYEITCGIGPRVPRRYISSNATTTSTSTSSASQAATAVRTQPLAAQGRDA
jgi:alanine racemase